MDRNTPEKLRQAIVEFLDSNYSQEDLVKMYDDARKCVIRFWGDYSALPTLPAWKDNPLDGLRDVMDWCTRASEVVDEIPFNMERQTISEVIRQLKKLREMPSRLLSLVNRKLLKQAQDEAKTIEQETASAPDAVTTQGSPLLMQAKLASEAELKNLNIGCEGTTQAARSRNTVQIYLSKDPIFKNKLSKLSNEINETANKVNKLIDNTPTGKLLDIYCKLKDIPLQQLYNEVGRAYPNNDLSNMIFGNGNRLYASIDNVIKIFDEIQTKAEQKKVEDIKDRRNVASEHKDTETKPALVGKQKKEEKPKTKMSKSAREIVSLENFMQRHCKLYKGIDLKSRKQALYKAHKRTITLPKLARRRAKGKSNVYYADDLTAKWEEFSRQVTLPPLQSAEN